jgi:hypothetical protein
MYLYIYLLQIHRRTSVFWILMSSDLVSRYQISSETLVTTTKQRISTSVNSLSFTQCSPSGH